MVKGQDISDCTKVRKFLNRNYNTADIGDKCCVGEKGIECKNGFITKFNKSYTNSQNFTSFPHLTKIRINYCEK